jgi:hypothetical protein
MKSALYLLIVGGVIAVPWLRNRKAKEVLQ